MSNNEKSKRNIPLILGAVLLVAVSGGIAGGLTNNSIHDDVDYSVEKDVRNIAVSIEALLATDHNAVETPVKDLKLKIPVTNTKTNIKVAGTPEGYCVTGINSDGGTAKTGFTYGNITGKVMKSDGIGCVNGEFIPDIMPDSYYPEAISDLTNDIDKSVEDDMQEVAFKIREKVKADPSLLDKGVETLGIKFTLNHKNNTVRASGTAKDFCLTGQNTGRGTEFAIDGLSYKSATDKMSTDSCNPVPVPKIYTIPSEIPENTIPFQDVTVLPLMDSALRGADSSSQKTLLASGGTMGASALGLGLIYILRRPRKVIQMDGIQKSKKQNVSEWNNVIARYNSIIKEWSSYELDPAKIISYPIITNMSNPVTAEFYKHLLKAKHLVPAKPSLMNNIDVMSSPFKDSVDKLEFQLQAMLNEAQRVKWNNLTKKEQTSLRTAQNLLDIAMNTASSDNERQIAYKQLLKEVEGIVIMPKETLLRLEEKVTLMLDAKSS